MTPQQYYFPYIFDLDDFNKQLASFDLSAYIKQDNETGMPETLCITRCTGKDALVAVSFGRMLMLHADKLFHWETDTNLVDIVQISLQNLTNDPWVLNVKIDLSELDLWKNLISTELDIDCFVTYAKKDSLMYDQDLYEKFVIVLVEKQQITLLPFDWFNKKASEYDYVWPATAQLDRKAEKIYGRGIRMPDFCLQLYEACL